MITPLRRVGAGGDQENVIFLSPGVTVKPIGGPVGADVEKQCIYPLTHAQVILRCIYTMHTDGVCASKVPSSK